MSRILQAITATAPKAAEWVNVDPATLSADLQTAYSAYKAAAKLASEARAAFEAAMTSAVDPLPGERLAFGYKFGKLSMAIIPDDGKRPAKAALSLADFKARR